ncbi:MAG: hypothetical protein ACXV8L_10265 [Ilumatobacteraceae bacterium]
MTRVSRGELIREIGTIVHDLPLFITAPLYRKWHLRWGATDDEVAAAMPGDGLFPRAQFKATRAITIDAAPDEVWPWLVQIGCRRAGWYSNDLLDNVGHPSSSTILPDLQQLEVGQWVPMSPKPTPTDHTAFKVESFEVDQWMLWTKPDSTWVWKLTPTTDDGTRLVTRIYAVRDWRHPLSSLVGTILMEFADFAMMRRMLRGIKIRAEGLARQRALMTGVPLGAR